MSFICARLILPAQSGNALQLIKLQIFMVAASHSATRALSLSLPLSGYTRRLTNASQIIPTRMSRPLWNETHTKRRKKYDSVRNIYARYKAHTHTLTHTLYPCLSLSLFNTAVLSTMSHSYGWQAKYSKLCICMRSERRSRRGRRRRLELRS